MFETYLADFDLDGFGDIGTDSISCILPVGYLLYTGGLVDCNGSDSLINPNAIKITLSFSENRLLMITKMLIKSELEKDSGEVIYSFFKNSTFS